MEITIFFITVYLIQWKKTFSTSEFRSTCGDYKKSYYQWQKANKKPKCWYENTFYAETNNWNLNFFPSGSADGKLWWRRCKKPT